MKDLYLRFKEFVENQDLFGEADHVLAAVSGGVDSMSMLDCLLKYSCETDLKLYVAHVNHRLRGQQSDQDEALVRAFCSQNGLKYYIKQYNVDSSAKEHGLSVEMAGRRLRYRFFNDTARNTPNCIIATGHTLDDHVETVLMRILKGTGWQGLCGITIKRDNIVRPLRFARKKELYDYARVQQIPFREDHTNFISMGQRNILRNEVIPLLTDKINPQLHKAVDRLSNIGRETHIWLQEEIKQYYRRVVIKEERYQIVLEIAGLKNYFRAIKKGILLQSIAKLEQTYAPQYNYLIMDNLVNLINRSKTGKHLRLSKKIWANIDRGRLILAHKKFLDWDGSQITMGAPFETTTFRFKAALVPRADYRINKSSDMEFIDYDKVKGKFKLRQWQPGDSFQPLGFNHHKKVSDLFVDHKISRFKKQQIPILVDQTGVVWVCGLRLAERVKITADTQQVVKLTYEEKHARPTN